jgi:cell division protein FtsB
MEVVKLEIILSGVLTVMVGLVAYFLKQLVSDFKKVESDLTQVKNTTEIIRTESKGMNDLIHQRIDFLERRVNRLENQTFNES